MGYDPPFGQPPGIFNALQAVVPGVRTSYNPRADDLAFRTLEDRPDFVVLEHSKSSDAAAVSKAFRAAAFTGPTVVSGTSLRRAGGLERLEGCDVVLAPLTTSGLKEAARPATRRLIGMLDERDSADLPAIVKWLRNQDPGAFFAGYHAEPRVCRVASGRLLPHD